jgi:hypothetical protein
MSTNKERNEEAAARRSDENVTRAGETSRIAPDELDPRRESPGFLSDEKEKRERMRDAETVPIKLTRSIVLDGAPADAGSVHEVPRPLAHRLVGEGSAVHHGDAAPQPGQPKDPRRVGTQGNRMAPTEHRDPDTGEMIHGPETHTRPAAGKSPTVTKS